MAKKFNGLKIFNMKNLILKNSGVNVKEGDKIYDGLTNTIITVTSLNIPQLVQQGILDFQNNDKVRYSVIAGPSKDIDIQDIYRTVDEAIEDSFDAGCDVGEAICDNYYPQYINMCFKEIAILLDQKYPNHIKDCTSYWVYSWLTDDVVEVPNTNISTYKATALFRTKEDAEYAVELLRNDIKYALE